MYTTVIAALSSPDDVHAGVAGTHDAFTGTIEFRTAPAQQVVVYLPPDDRLALDTIDRLRAVLENVETAVMLRAQRREQADFTGAGESVEAYRG